MSMMHIGEIVEAVQKASTKEEAIGVLQKHRDNAPFRLFLNYMFNPAISFYAFGDTLPDIKGTGLPYGRGISLYSQMRRFSFFVLEPGRNYPHDRMMKMLIQVVENLPGIEADLVKSILTGTAIPGMTLDLVMEAYPEDVRFQRVVTATGAFESGQTEPVEDRRNVNTETDESTVVAVVPENPVTETVSPVPEKRGRGRPRKVQPDTQETTQDEETDGTA